VLISWIGYAALFAGTWALSRGSRRAAVRPAPAAAPAFAARAAGPPYAALAVATSVLLLAGLAQVPRVAPAPLARDLAAFPDQVGGWRQAGEGRGPTAHLGEGADRTLARRYVSPAGDSVLLFVGYYESQRQGRELVMERGSNDHLDASRVALDLGSGEELLLNRIVERRRRGSYLMLYWYEVGGRRLTDRYLAKAYTTWDGLVRRRTGGAVVLVGVELTEGVGAERAEDLARAFLAEAAPVLRGYLPAS
jgi:EpsI family protein